MIRVSPSIAERCRIFCNGTSDDNDGNFRRKFCEDGTTQTASGIPVPISNLRKDHHPTQNSLFNANQMNNDCHQTLELSRKQSKENELQRTQRRLRTRWETPNSNSKILGAPYDNDVSHYLRHTTAGCFETYTNNNDKKYNNTTRQGCMDVLQNMDSCSKLSNYSSTNRLSDCDCDVSPNFEFHDSKNSGSDAQKSLETATMNFSAEDFTTTADETDGSKTDSRSPSPHRRSWRGSPDLRPSHHGPNTRPSPACSLPSRSMSACAASCSQVPCTLTSCSIPACCLPSCSQTSQQQHLQNDQPPAWTAVVHQPLQVLFTPDYRNSCPSIIESHSPDKKPLRFITNDRHPLDLTSETETSDTNTGSFDYRLFSKTSPFTRPLHRDAQHNDSGNECGTAFSPYQSVKKKSLYEFSDTAQSEDDQTPTCRDYSGWRCSPSEGCMSTHPSSHSIATFESGKSNLCLDRPTSTTTVIQRSYSTANTPTNVDSTPTSTPYHLNSSEDYNLTNNASDKDSINEETLMSRKTDSLDEDVTSSDNPGPRLSWSPKPSKKRIGRGRSMRRDEKCLNHPDDKLTDVGTTCTCSASKNNNGVNNTNTTGRHGGRRRRDVSPSLSLGGIFGGRNTMWNGGPGQESPPPGRRDPYRRSVSLGQILQGDGHSERSAHRGSREGCTPEIDDPDGDTDERELTEFEKENLLFLKDLDNSYHNQEPIYMEPYDMNHMLQMYQQQPGPYHRTASVLSNSNTSLVSAYSDDSVSGESTPRGSCGSPFRGSGQRPSPSRAQNCYLLRSASRPHEEQPAEEEDEVEDDEGEEENLPSSRARSSIPVPTSMNPLAIAAAAVAAVNAAAAAQYNHNSGSGPSTMSSSGGVSSASWWSNNLYGNSSTLPRLRSSDPPLHSSTHMGTPPRERNCESPSSSRVRSIPSHSTARTHSSSSSVCQWTRSNSPTTTRTHSPTSTLSAAPPSQIPRSVLSLRQSFARNAITSTSSNQFPSSGIPSTRGLRSLSSASYRGVGMNSSVSAIPRSRGSRDRSPHNESSSGTSRIPGQSSLSADRFIQESPRKDSDPDISAEVPPILTGTTPAAGQASSPSGADVKSLSEAVGGEDDTEGAGGAGNSGDAASSTGSEGRRAATAFTIELDKEDDGEGSAKKLDIAGPLSKWAPKHRRNLSLTKVEENKKVEERGGKPPVYRARSGTLGVGGGACNPGAGGVLLRKVGGYHSEGYFSSDQDEDAPRKTDVKSPRSPRTPDAAKSPVVVTLANGVPKSPSQDFSRASSSSLRGRPASPDLGAARRTSAATITLNESANFLIEKMINSTPETKRKSSVGSRPGDSARTCCKGLDKKPSVADITGRSSRSSSEKGSKGSSKMDGRKQEDSTHTNCQPFKIDRLADDMAREEDEVSEAGTYTIDKESSPDADKPQADIEGAFRHAALAEEATAYGSANTPLWDTAEMNSGISRSSPNWIQQWAAQVAEQTSGGDLSDPSKCNELPTLKSSHTSTRLGKTSHLPSAVGSSADNDHLRPRRKLPTPPSLMQQSYPSSAARSNELAELEALAKTRLMSLCDEADREALQVLQDTETRSYLRDTEHLLTSLQARVTDNTPITSSGGYRIASFESHDSGGDSDVDTSTSFALQEDRTPALRSKLKLSGLDSSSKGFGAALNNSRTSKVDPVVSSHLKRERSIVSEGGYAKSLLPCTVTNPMSKSLCLVGCTNSEALCQGSCLMTKSLTEEIPNSEALGQLNCTITKLPGQASCTERDSTSFTAEKSELSDSSSETSMKTQRKTMNNPPLKYNRAFSLRRARLGADDVHNARQAPLTPTERRKQTSPLLRSSSAAAVPRKTPHVRSTGGATVPSSLQQGVSKSPSRSSINKKDFASNKKATGLSRPGAAALSTKEVDFQNWKRRKNYDPMKAAKDGRQKQLEKRNTEKITNDNITSSDRGSPSPPGSLLRSASFHGTEAMLGGGSRWPRLPQSSYIPPNTYTSEDDGPMSYDEESAVNCLPRSSPLRRSPTSPHQLSQSPHASSPSHSAAAARRRRSSYAHSDDSEHVLSSPSRKMTVEETGSEGKRSPLSVGGGMTSSAGSRGAALPSNSGRNRAKIEALDNLVISTIHSLSNKVRGTSENLLQKLKTQYGEEDRDRADLLQNVLNHLNSESESASSQIRSTSKDLSGILKNLKKIQTALEVIDQVMVEGGGDYDDLEDIDWPPNAAGSDY
ncbi:uncharacterized protein LOC108679320 isoform X2 [Hyalella azteca]|uniref:Uncharacterized protein LOC108679320 isoform X2 n=1 Tax=Hyalella azteca TaxID=294128 RepID=A0A8B7PBE6_HYAAZ|nr:uncharacterized protein LOC108679320 isoform X2 [Hyalella azteca]